MGDYLLQKILGSVTPLDVQLIRQLKKIMWNEVLQVGCLRLTQTRQQTALLDFHQNRHNLNFCPDQLGRN